MCPLRTLFIFENIFLKIKKFSKIEKVVNTFSILKKKFSFWNEKDCVVGHTLAKS